METILVKCQKSITKKNSSYTCGQNWYMLFVYTYSLREQKMTYKLRLITCCGRDITGKMTKKTCRQYSFLTKNQFGGFISNDHIFVTVARCFVNTGYHKHPLDQNFSIVFV